MALKAILESLDGLSDEIKKEYVEKDGKFVLDVEATSGFELANTAGLKTALQTERQRARDAQAKLKAFDGIDPEDAKSAIAKIAELGDAPDAKKQLEEALKTKEATLLKKHEGERKTLTDQIEKLRKQVEKDRITAAATKSITDAKGSVALLLPHVQRQTRMRTLENGELVAEVVDPDTGVARVNSAGNAMSIAELVDEMRSSEDYQQAFAGSGASGSGAAGGGTGKPGGGEKGKGGSRDGKPPKTISVHDQEGLNKYWQEIGKGEVVVVDSAEAG